MSDYTLTTPLNCLHTARITWTSGDVYCTNCSTLLGRTQARKIAKAERRTAYHAKRRRQRERAEEAGS